MLYYIVSHRGLADRIVRYIVFVAFDVMQAELDQVGESTGLMSLRQTEYFDGDEKHLKFLEGYPEVRLPGRHFLHAVKYSLY
jgi:hypothetical protein